MDKINYAKYIDHTVLKTMTTKKIIKKFCEEAIEYDFASVCINSCFVSYAAELLKNTDVKVCTVVGFPLGANTTNTKAFEAKEAIQNGAEEIDMVMNLGALVEKNYELVLNDIKALVDICQNKAILKVIVESSELTDEQLKKACVIAKNANADFVKTSTGFLGKASIEAVQLMKSVVGDELQIKASTGIVNREICDQMINAGATRMGTSKGIIIVEDKQSAPKV